MSNLEKDQSNASNVGIIMIVLCVVGIIIVPIIMDSYSPLASFVSDFGDVAPSPAPMENENSPLEPVTQPPAPTTWVLVCGYIYFDGNFTPVTHEEIRLYGTDQLEGENVTTNSYGYYESTILYDRGQLMAITVLDQRFTRFISYYAVAGEVFELDMIFI